jgi:hypothetical protein
MFSTITSLNGTIFGEKVYEHEYVNQISLISVTGEQSCSMRTDGHTLLAVL